MLIELRIDKEKIINNIEKIREINNNIICVLKDDAYGLGIENVLPVVLSQNI
ncbi:MAG: alanine racemase, partial [Leptotrichiaceae bacterium]